LDGLEASDRSGEAGNQSAMLAFIIWMKVFSSDLVRP
jgi:hypothetical protein